MDMPDQVSVSANAQPVAEPELRRTFSLWSSFSFSLAFISPCVALYGVYDLSITTAGPSFWLSSFPGGRSRARSTSGHGGCSGRAAAGSAAGSTSGR